MGGHFFRDVTRVFGRAASDGRCGADGVRGRILMGILNSLESMAGGEMAQSGDTHTRVAGGLM